MKQSTYPLELLLGMKYYASDAEGIGGQLRSVPEDFIVEEIPLPEKGGTSGPYLICKLTKQTGSSSMQLKKLQNGSASVTGGLDGRAPKTATPSRSR